MAQAYGSAASKKATGYHKKDLGKKSQDMQKLHDVRLMEVH